MKYQMDFSFLDDFTNERIVSKKLITDRINDYLKKQKNQTDMIVIDFFHPDMPYTIQIFGWADMHYIYDTETGKQKEKHINPYYIDIVVKTDYQYNNLYHYEKKQSITIDGSVRRAIYSNNMDNVTWAV